MQSDGCKQEGWLFWQTEHLTCSPLAQTAFLASNLNLQLNELQTNLKLIQHIDSPPPQLVNQFCNFLHSLFLTNKYGVLCSDVGQNLSSLLNVPLVSLPGTLMHLRQRLLFPLPPPSTCCSFFFPPLYISYLPIYMHTPTYIHTCSTDYIDEGK